MLGGTIYRAVKYMDKQEYKSIAALAANGDAKAFSHLYETLYREMYYTALYSLDSSTDAIEAVLGTVKDGFAAVGRLRSESAFRTFMMKSLCARIKLFLKERSDSGNPVRYDESAAVPGEDGIDIAQEFNRLDDMERVVTALYAVGRFTAEEISAFTGLSQGNVRKKLKKGLELFELD